MWWEADAHLVTCRQGYKFYVANSELLQYLQHHQSFIVMCSRLDDWSTWIWYEWELTKWVQDSTSESVRWTINCKYAFIYAELFYLPVYTYCVRVQACALRRTADLEQLRAFRLAPRSANKITPTTIHKFALLQLRAFLTRSDKLFKHTA